MESHAITMSAVAASIFIISWISASAYLFSGGKANNNGTTKDKSHAYSWTFHVESLRFFGYLNYLVILGLCAVITETSGFETIPTKTDTVVYKLLGFNHACNWFDHNPARMIAAILYMPLVQLPMMLYSVFWHCRLAKDVKTGKVPTWLLNMSRVITPFTFITMSQLHLWFVNTPGDTYGFVAHYIPYLMFQITIVLYQLLSVCYLAEKGQLPWGIPRWLAWSYIPFIAGTLVVYTVIVCMALAGAPIAMPAGLEHQNPIFYAFYVFGFYGSLILSGKERLNGDTMTFTIGDDLVSLETTEEDNETVDSEVKEEDQEQQEMEMGV